MTPLRIGLLGCGRIGRMHADLLTHHVEALSLSAVHDTVAGVAGGVAAATGARVAASTRDLIDADDVDAVAICTSTDTHVDLLLRACDAGKPVFVEKPLALTLDDVDRAMAAVPPHLTVQVGFNRRFDPSHRVVRERVAAGDIGDVHLVRITSRDPEPPPHDTVDRTGGIFLDMTVHDFDMARHITGRDVCEVYATGATRIDPMLGRTGDLDTAVLVLTHEGGAITTIDNSRRAVYGYDQRVEAFGSGGMVASDNPLTTSATYRAASGTESSPMPTFFIDRYRSSYLAAWESFAECAAAGRPAVAGVGDGRAALLAGLAAATSVRERRPVSTAEAR